ncbi:YoaK family protein [Rhodococcus pyridinivorans]|uniref:YoaK family protein n=1 Tax=Rhodococcus pyridinivorans TaxID=103816 RepID=UPI000E724084|nr:YoaK family protein [Rhodococcus pyridinivorans]WAL46862.1 YoaK family protein [Rhodococcus pyridinivorans]
MVGYGRQLQGLAIALSSLAGFIDALGFITLGGVFVSFMSGNSTRFAVGTADGAWQTVALIGGVLALFVVGVILGSVVAELTDRDRRTRKTAVLATVTVLLTIAAAAVLVDWTPVAVIAMTLAMGTENSVFRRHGETTVALTYMTGALVKIGQRIAAAFFGGPRWSWLPYLGLWGGLVTGAVLGALAHRVLGLHALWIAAAFAAALTVAVRFLSDHELTGGV